MTLNDFIHGVDFTVLPANLATGGDHNSLVDLAVPAADKGLVLWSVDTASGIPDVPDPTPSAPYNKWMRYIWIRIPFAGEAVKQPTIYGWNDDAVSVATYLKWINLGTDVAALQAQINTALANAATAVALANTANTNAGTAATQAAASLAASAANTIAVAAVVTDVANANVTAAGASATAVNAQTQANAALAAANALKTPAAALTVGLPRQIVRTNDAGTLGEWAYQGVIQSLIKTSGVADSTAVALPFDATIPQITEGKEFITLAITPKSAASILRIRFTCFMDSSAGGMGIALFQDAIANALCAVPATNDTLTSPTVLEYYCLAASVTARTYRIRFGADSGTAYMNQNSSVALYGAAAISFLTIEEIVATLS